jgi:hypothetical protein
MGMGFGKLVDSEKNLTAWGNEIEFPLPVTTI